MKKFNLIIIGLMLLASGLVQADDLVDSVGFTPTLSTQANWLFIGTVVNDDAGENFNYVFQMQRDGNKFKALVIVVDSQTQMPIIVEESSAEILDPESYNWNVGQVFLRFNPINASWILGFNAKDKFSFNFKVDLLKPFQQTPISQDLRPGVDLLVLETGQLNGHIKHNSKQKEQFVTARTTWFKQTRFTAENNTGMHNLNSVLCQFEDWSGFYSVNLPEVDALRASIAGAFDAHGNPLKISQFINIHEKKSHDWQINITSPISNLTLHPVIDKGNVIAGYNQSQPKGFCVITHELLGKAVHE
jgi:hypothetical protein